MANRKPRANMEEESEKEESWWILTLTGIRLPSTIGLGPCSLSLYTYIYTVVDNPLQFLLREDRAATYSTLIAGDSYVFRNLSGRARARQLDRKWSLREISYIYIGREGYTEYKKRETI